MKNWFANWSLVILWMIAIFIGSSIGNLPTFDGGIIDRLMHWLGHLSEYAILAIVLLRALSVDRPIGGREILLALLVIAMYGLSDEFHQRFVAGRSSDATTVLIDLAGGSIGAAIWQWRHRIASRSESASRRMGE